MILGSVVVGDAGRRKRISTESAEDGALRARRRLTRRVSRSGETRADAVAQCFAVDGLAFEGGLGGFYYGTHLLDGGGGGFGDGFGDGAGRFCIAGAGGGGGREDGARFGFLLGAGGMTAGEGGGVIGAGVFGVWSGWHLGRRGRRVLLADAYGPGNARASSAGESRIIRMGYGADELYTRWSVMSLAQWKEFFAATGQPLFHETGVLWLAGKEDLRVRQTGEALRRCGIAYQDLNRAGLEKRYPQIGLAGITRGVLEPPSGVLMARGAVAAVV